MVLKILIRNVYNSIAEKHSKMYFVFLRKVKKILKKEYAMESKLGRKKAGWRF